jgi:hypothetical protein
MATREKAQISAMLTSRMLTLLTMDNMQKRYLLN